MRDYCIYVHGLQTYVIEGTWPASYTPPKNVSSVFTSEAHVDKKCFSNVPLFWHVILKEEHITIFKMNLATQKLQKRDVFSRCKCLLQHTGVHRYKEVNRKAKKV